MFTVSEVVRFCYGHRLLDYVGRCARIHGHNAKVEIVVGALHLDHRGFVCDFADLERVANAYVESMFDHRLLLRHDDPLIPRLLEADEDHVALAVNPTAENLAQLIGDHLIAQGFAVVEIRFFETETSVAVYRPLTRT